MPQATLLSYFSKSVTPAPSIPPTARETDAITTDHHGCLRVSESRGLGIIEAARKQASQKTTKPTVCNLNAEEGQVESRRSDDVSQEPKRVRLEAEDLSRDRLQHFDGASIPHLPEALVAPIAEQHIAGIRRLTATILPVRYGDAFFTNTVTDPMVNQLSRVVLYASQPVGWIRCRLEPCSPNHYLITQPHPPPSQIYIQALALLSPYRGLGLATLLLDTILSSAIAQAADTVCVYAHVWEQNEDALEWYAKRGFKRVMLVEQYYRRLRPSGAWIVRRDLERT
ncbi:uncharacterized protein Z520_09381 [Fonsecaea multimorphosa CBS 102226]|uniref:N-acetyltransferase domain-containing protein n=1 Tax=Fonsecaea multimorphosa CBS 102226 TaxID=1442371 RepID=A0A0D2ID68_9EURO|nr:uncharacterized protein Z520_09381 [Fonsecaea multimorphosa CBS 102226]KIX95071.1 hypothetical protein Z520_09381 [Fonsecaea multimorphosa CBS 102226]OAL20714.1 hypothetical protein AYO22_08723 [Fonsecaea multimorphosa]